MDHSFYQTYLFPFLHTITGVPGSFTPGCSKTHLPGYIADYDALKAAGAEIIVCVSVNDVFVHSAWGEAHGADSKVRFGCLFFSFFSFRSFVTLLIFLFEFRFACLLILVQSSPVL